MAAISVIILANALVAPQERILLMELFSWFPGSRSYAARASASFYASGVYLVLRPPQPRMKGPPPLSILLWPHYLTLEPHRRSAPHFAQAGWNIPPYQAPDYMHNQPQPGGYGEYGQPPAPVYNEPLAPPQGSLNSYGHHDQHHQGDVKEQDYGPA